MTQQTLKSALIASICLLPAVASAHSLPIGDGNVATAPEQGSVFACQTNFRPIGPRAPTTGDWFDAANGTWDPAIKPFVDGSVSWPSEIAISIEGNKRVISGNGLPDHATGSFPIAKSDDAYQFDRNPNAIEAQNVLLRLDTTPKLANNPTCVPMGMIGFTLSGAALYNALDASGLDAAAHEIQDKCKGHPQGAGQYHYHSASPCLADTKSGPDGHSDLLGYALDGFGIYGMYDVGGAQLSSDDLDACHGHTGKVEWDGKTTEIYHYHFSEDYPYTLGCFMGQVTQSASAKKHLNRPDRPGIGQRPMRPIR